MNDPASGAATELVHAAGRLDTPPGRLRYWYWGAAGAHLLVTGLYLLGALVIMWPMFGPGTPPGVDPPLFLHGGWIVERTLTGQLDSPFWDPYWYGGHPYLQAYPPLAPGLIGIVAVLTPATAETAYRILLFAAHVALGLSVYVLALEYGVRRFGATLAGLLVLTSYPVLAGLALYGWFSTLVALPLGIFGFAMLERSLRMNNRLAAVASGALFAGVVLSNLQVAFAFALALAPWLVYRLTLGTTESAPSARDAPPEGPADAGIEQDADMTGSIPRRVARGRAAQLVAYSGATALIVSGPWAVFAVPHLLDVGFQQVPPGNWVTTSGVFLSRVFDRSLIGSQVYPHYLGIAQVLLGLAGLVYALFTRGRSVAAVPVFVVMLWFAMGQGINPLIQHGPFVNVDIARYSLFMMPFLALFAGAWLDGARAGIQGFAERLRLPRQAARGVLGLAGLLVMAIPAADVAQARPAFSPVHMGPEIAEALEWLEQETAPDATVLGLGMRYWGAWWIPYHAERPVMDGWNDEGSARWETVREVRIMGWQREVDVERLHEVMAEFDTDYLLITHWTPHGAPDLFEAQVMASPHLFELRAAWRDVAIYERLTVGPLDDAVSHNR